jgi:protein-S-isoprenylcysteine O-methyltransferase Ste14
VAALVTPLLWAFVAWATAWIPLAGVVVGLALFALGFALKAKVEERFLESELGGYEGYRARVPMIVPFFRRKPSPRIG